MSVKERLKLFIKYLKIGNSEFEKSLGLSNGYINSISRGIGNNKLNLILEKYSNLNGEWLLTGKGEMIKSTSNIVEEPLAEYKTKKKSSSLIPLLPIDAVAGFGVGEWSIHEKDIQERYQVPDFNGIDFMIRVKGSSMYPKYNSGDVIACRKINYETYIQWNKPHVISTTEQGIIVKRINAAEDKNMLTMTSDNPAYPPFNVPKNEITGIALIIGVIRLE